MNNLRNEIHPIFRLIVKKTPSQKKVLILCRGKPTMNHMVYSPSLSLTGFPNLTLFLAENWENESSNGLAAAGGDKKVAAVTSPSWKKKKKNTPPPKKG